MNLINVKAPNGGKDYFMIRDNYMSITSNYNPINGIHITGVSSNI